MDIKIVICLCFWELHDAIKIPTEVIKQFQQATGHEDGARQLPSAQHWWLCVCVCVCVWSVDWWG